MFEIGNNSFEYTVGKLKCSKCEEVQNNSLGLGNYLIDGMCPICFYKS